MTTNSRAPVPHRASAPRRPAVLAKPPGSDGRPPAVAVLSDDPLVRDGAVAYLSASGAVRVVGPDDTGPVDVLLVLAGTVTDGILADMREAGGSGRGQRPRIVLVADEISEIRLIRAVESGLTSLLLRPDSSYGKIIEAIARCRHETVLPGAAMRTLIEYLRCSRLELSSGLSRREVDVLRFVADGVGTAEIAERMQYSERTIKNILNGIMKRLSLHNRAHAVSYAMRAGLL